MNKINFKIPWELCSSMSGHIYSEAANYYSLYKHYELNYRKLILIIP